MVSCYKNNLYVQQQKMDKDFLASTYVKTPDPRQENPPHGERLVINWDFSFDDFQKKLTLLLKVLYWNNLQESFFYPIERIRDYKTFYFDHAKDQRILTYIIEIITEEGEIIRTWQHQLWTKLISFDKKSSAHNISFSVEDQPKQGSVSERPQRMEEE